MQKPWVSKKEVPKELTSPPRTPTPPPSPPFSTAVPEMEKTHFIEDTNRDTVLKSDEQKVPRNLLLRSVYAIEKEFWSSDDDQRNPGILVTAVNHIYKDVYRLPFTLS